MVSTKDMQTRLRMMRQAQAQQIQAAKDMGKAPTVAVLQQVIDWTEDTQRVVDATVTKLEALHADPNFSDTGKQARRATIAQEARVSMEFLNRQREKVRTDIENLRLLLMPSGKPAASDVAERLIRRLDEAEIRREYKGKSPLELGQVFVRAVERGDTLIVSALRNCPLGPLVPQEVLDEMDRRQSETENPTGFERLQALKDAQVHLETLWRQVLVWLKELGANVESLASVVVTSNA